MDFIEDILIISGAAIIIGTTFMLSVTAGCYILGLTLLSAGVLAAKYPGKRGKK